MDHIRYALEILLRALYVYVIVLATWWIVLGVRDIPIDPEGGAFLQAIYAPLVTAVILIVVYALSMLDKTALSFAFIGCAVVISQLATLTGWSVDTIISEEYIFFAHLLAIVGFFIAWHVVRLKYKQGSSAKITRQI